MKPHIKIQHSTAASGSRLWSSEGDTLGGIYQLPGGYCHSKMLWGHISWMCILEPVPYAFRWLQWQQTLVHVLETRSEDGPHVKSGSV